MGTVKCKDLQVGMCVLLTIPDPEYSIGESNPKVGTKWECFGSVLRCDVGKAEVVWENGCMNTYKDNELSPACEGRCKSIW